MTGHAAAALAILQAAPHVVALCAGDLRAELERLRRASAEHGVRTTLPIFESVRSALSAALAGSAAGGRSAAAAHGVGLVRALDVYLSIAALRLPVVLAMANDHAGGLHVTGGDATDAMLARGGAWVQWHAENPQEVYDLVLQAFRLAEDPRVRLPVAVCYDGSAVGQVRGPVNALTDAEAGGFVGPLLPAVDLLDVANPHAVGGRVASAHAPAMYAQLAEALRWAPAVMDEIAEAYAALTGRSGGLLEAYRWDDAEVAIVAAGAVCATVRAAVDGLRATGVRAGLLKLRCVRPFPAAAVAAALHRPGLRAAAVLENTVELGTGGPVFIETAAALARPANGSNAPRPLLMNVIAGLGGAAVTTGEIETIFGELAGLTKGTAPPDADPVRFWCGNHSEWSPSPCVERGLDQGGTP